MLRLALSFIVAITITWAMAIYFILPDDSERKKPIDLDWQPCECGGMTRGLSDGDIMKLNMYLSSDMCKLEE